MGAPLLAEAVGDLAIDRAGAQRPLRPVVGGFEIPVLDEDEELRSDLEDHAFELDPGGVGGIERHDAVEAALQVGLVGFQGRGLEGRPPPPDRAGPFEQMFQAWPEHGVAGLDGVPDVADQVRQADLMLLFGPARLGAEAVRGPEVGVGDPRGRLPPPPWSDGRRRRRRRCRRWWNTLSHQLARPTRTPGLVGRDGGAPEQARLDERGRGLERRGARRQHVDERALADRKAEQVEERVAQPRQRDALDRAKVDDESADVGPEGRARLQARRRLGLEAPGAARAGAAVERHARHVRLDLGGSPPGRRSRRGSAPPPTRRPRRPGMRAPARRGGGSGWDGAGDGRRDEAWPCASKPRAATASAPSTAAGSSCPASWAAGRAWPPTQPHAPQGQRSAP